MPTRTVTPAGHGSFIQAISLYNRLHGAAIHQQRDDDHHPRAIAAHPCTQRTLPAAERFPTTLALIAHPFTSVAHDIPVPALPSCFTLTNKRITY